MIFLGDIHGDFRHLSHVLKHAKESVVQVGDLGIGFPNSIDASTGRIFPREPETFPDNFSFIRGNHDNPEVCKKYPNYLGDFGFNGKFFYVSGAWSIDRSVRVENRDWWAREELSAEELYNAIMLYDHHLPEIIVTHTCPPEIAKMIVGGDVHGSRTEVALRSMFEIHKPSLWIFGHWHVAWRKNILGTMFHCLSAGGKLKVSGS